METEDDYIAVALSDEHFEDPDAELPAEEEAALDGATLDGAVGESQTIYFSMEEVGGEPIGEEAFQTYEIDPETIHPANLG